MQPIDWTAIEAQRGTYDPEQQRAFMEMEVLGDASRRLLERAQVVEQTHAANLADPGLGPAVARTADLVEQAGYIEMAQADERQDIVDAHRRGLTVAQWQDRVEAAIAYAESPEYAQAVWERQGEQYENDRPGDAEWSEPESDQEREPVETDAEVAYAESYGERSQQQYVDRMTERDLAGKLDGAQSEVEHDNGGADSAPSVGAELRDARVYLEQRTQQGEQHSAPPAGGAEQQAAAREEQAHRESARVMADRQQAEPQRGIER
jgi:hypothetical protein